MTDMYPLPAPGQHDTAALPRPYPVGGGGTNDGTADGAGFVPGFGPPQPGSVGANPEAEAWQARYLLQRARTRVAVVAAVLAALVALGMGVVAWQVSQANPLLSAAADLARGGGLDLEGIAPEGAVPEERALGEGGGGADGSVAVPDVPISELPGVPDEVKALAAALGITDLGQLLDLAVSYGFMTEAEADQLSAAVAAGVVARDQ